MRPIDRALARAGALLLCSALLYLPPAYADEPADLGVRKLKIRTTPKGSTCKLRLELPLDPVLDTVDVRTADVAIRVNDRVVFALPPAAERKRLREKKRYLWRYRARRPTTRMKLDLAFRDVSIVTRKVDLAGALDQPAQGVKVSLLLGEQVFETVVDIDVKGRTLKLRPEEPIGGGPPDDPGGGGDPSPVTWNVVEQTWFSGIQLPETAVARSSAEWTALWARHTSQIIPPPAAPSVDFSSQMVVGVFLGDRPDPSHAVEIATIRSDGSTTAVDYRDVRFVSSQAGACFFPAVVAQPTVLVSVPRTERVTFAGRIVQRGCP